MSSRSVHFFDVFETSVTRQHATSPGLIAEAVTDLLGSSDEELVGEVVRLRIVGERRTSTSVGTTCLLPEIYSALVELRGLGIDPAALADAETRMELAQLRRVEPIAELISRLRRDGARIVFVSDMHFTAEQLRTVLVDLHVAEPDEPIYVSGEVGRTKASGELFDHVLAREGVDAKDVVHHGDNPYTDDLMPRSRGIAVASFEAGGLNRYELSTLRSQLGPRHARSLVAGAQRLARLSCPDPDPQAQTAAAIGACAVGPLITGFVRWVLDDARQRGLEHLCFVARDGQVMHQVAERIRRDTDPQCHYVLGSRRAWSFPAVHAGRIEELGWVFETGNEVETVGTVLGKVGVSVPEASEILARHHISPDERVADGHHQTAEAALAACSELVVRRAAEARERLRRYLSSFGVLSGQAWATVDVGWAARTHTLVRTAFDLDERFGGYYLAVHADRLPLDRTGWFRALVREDEPGGRQLLDGGWLLDEIAMVEQVLTRADHDGILGYDEVDGEIVPVHKPPSQTPSWFAPMRAATLAFADQAVASGIVETDGPLLRAVGLECARLFVQEPTADEARLFATTLASDDRPEHEIHPLVRPMTWGDIAHYARRKIDRRPVETQHYLYWPAGSRAITSPSVNAGRRLSAAASRRASSLAPFLRSYRRR